MRSMPAASESLKIAPTKTMTLKVDQIISYSTRKSFNLRVHFWMTVIELKEKILKEIGMPVASQRLFARNCELENNNTLESYNVLHKGRNTVLLVQRKALEGRNSFIEPYGDIQNNRFPSAIANMINEIMKGMALGLGPQLAFDGTAGTYFMRDQNRSNIGIFKPIDEEAYAPNNPRGYVGDFGQTSFRSGVLSGEGVIREVASYLLDSAHFSSVPATIFAECMHPSFNNSISQEIDSSQLESSSKAYSNVISSLIEPSLVEQSSSSTTDTLKTSMHPHTKIGMKYGSLQSFVHADDVASNLSSDLFSVDEVHKIAILDLRILNLDRNDGNILVKKKE